MIKGPATGFGDNSGFDNTVTFHIFERGHITELIFGWQSS